jgi:hypothetical protein
VSGLSCIVRRSSISPQKVESIERAFEPSRINRIIYTALCAQRSLLLSSNLSHSFSHLLGITRSIFRYFSNHRFKLPNLFPRCSTNLNNKNFKNWLTPFILLISSPEFVISFSIFVISSLVNSISLLEIVIASKNIPFPYSVLSFPKFKLSFPSIRLPLHQSEFSFPYPKL